MTLVDVLHAATVAAVAYFVLVVPLALAVGAMFRHRARDVWHCAHCDVEFDGATLFADHVFADHPDVLPRVDA